MRVAPLLLALAVGAAACGDRGPLPRKVANDSVSALLKSYQAQVEQAQ
jgi:predicted small lipoprotein YifL